MTDPDRSVAVTGLGVLVPGAHSPDRFYENLLRQRCFIRDIPAWLWERDVFLRDDAEVRNATYAAIAALVEDPPYDLASLRIPPSVSKRMSRSQKMGLYCAREALRDAGLLDSTSLDRDNVSVFMAAISGGEFIEAMSQSLAEKRVFARLREIASGTHDQSPLDALLASYEKDHPSHLITEDSLPGASPNLVAGRIASTFDFHGVNMALDAACASSLTAINLAVRSLQTGESDLVLAGGVDTWVDVGAFVQFAKIMALARTGCYPFDERANGLVIGEGCGVAVLKRLEDARRDQDGIYAIIRGVGCSSDGRGAGITVPTVNGQLLAMQRAYASAGVDPAALDYLECHGTGTKVGDPIELESMRQIVGGAGRSSGAWIPIGSVKASVGHLRTAAGMAGFCNAVKIIQHRVIPPQTNFETPTTAFDWNNAPLRVPLAPERLETDNITAGVSGFGFGGTNTHVVLSSPTDNKRRSTQVAFQFVRQDHPRLSGDIAFMFPGQGSQYVGMLSEVRDSDIGRDLFARADAMVKEVCHTTLSSVVYPNAPTPDDDLRLRSTDMAQPAILTLSAILLEMLREKGVTCSMVVGHSLGEYTALYASGVLSFEDAIRAVTLRGKLMADRAEGTGASTMAYLLGAPEEIDALIDLHAGPVTRANLNSYGQVVVSGAAEDVDRLVKQARELGLGGERLNVDRGFHSPFVAHAVAPMKRVLETMDLRYTNLPMPANISRALYPVTNDAAKVGQPLDAVSRARLIDLLASQVDHAVDFVSQIEWAYSSGIRRFLEVGPRRVLSGLVDDILQGKSFQVLAVDIPDVPPDIQVQHVSSMLKEPLRVSRRPLRDLRPHITEEIQLEEVSFDGMPLEDRVRSVVAQVSGYDASMLKGDLEFGRDLGLDSLKVVEIVSRLRGSIIPVHHRGFRHLTCIDRIVEVGKQAALSSPDDQAAQSEPAFRCYLNRLQPAQVQPGEPTGSEDWTLDAPEHVRSMLGVPTWSQAPESHQLFVRSISRSDTLCCGVLPELLSRIVGFSRDTIADDARFAVVTCGGTDDEIPKWFRALAGFMRSVALEFPTITFSYHHIDQAQFNAHVLMRCLSDHSIGKRLAADGTWAENELLPLNALPDDVNALSTYFNKDDLILVTGGARGIASLVVRSLLKRVAARFLLVGQRKDTEAWILEEGDGRVEYLSVDISNRSDLHAVKLRDMGVTLILHAAGLSFLTPLKDKPREELDRVIGVKALGLDNLLHELDVRRLRGIINFSSIVGHFGNLAQADYAAANGYLDGYVCAGVPVLSIGWTAWDDVGMATRGMTRSVLETSGIALLPSQRGVLFFERILIWWLRQENPEQTTTVNVFGDLGVSLKQQEMPKDAAAAQLPVVSGRSMEQRDEDVVILNLEGTTTPLFMICGVFGYGYRLQLVSREMSADVPAYILQPPGMDWSTVSCSTIPEMAAWYTDAIEKHRPDGPLALIGTSVGGNMVLEVALLLQKRERKVALLAMVDTMPPEEDPLEFDALEKEIGRLHEEARDQIQTDGADMAAFQLRALRAHELGGQFTGKIQYYLAVGWGWPGALDRRMLWNKYATEGMSVSCVSGVHGAFELDPTRREIGRHVEALLKGEPVETLTLSAYVARYGTYSIENRGGNESLRLPDGSILPIRRSRKNGTLDAVETYHSRIWVAGWAYDAGHNQPARMVVVFCGDTYLHAVVPSQPRPDVAALKGDGAAASGFAMVVDLYRKMPVRGDRFRLLSIGQDTVTEIGAFSWPPPDSNARLRSGNRMLQKLMRSIQYMKGD